MKDKNIKDDTISINNVDSFLGEVYEDFLHVGVNEFVGEILEDFRGNIVEIFDDMMAIVAFRLTSHGRHCL